MLRFGTQQGWSIKPPFAGTISEVVRAVAPNAIANHGSANYGVTRTLIARLEPFSWRYVTSAFAPTLSLPSIVVFLSILKVMVLGVFGSVCMLCVFGSQSV